MGGGGGGAGAKSKGEKPANQRPSGFMHKDIITHWKIIPYTEKQHLAFYSTLVTVELHCTMIFHCQLDKQPLSKTLIERSMISHLIFSMLPDL